MSSILPSVPGFHVLIRGFCALAAGSFFHTAAVAADWPLTEQGPVEYVRICESSGQAPWTSNQVVDNLKDQVRKGESAVETALNELREHGGENLANGVENTSDIKGQIDMVRAWHGAAVSTDPAVTGMITISSDLAPYLSNLIGALRGLRDSREQLAEAEQRAEAAKGASDQAGQGGRDLDCDVSDSASYLGLQGQGYYYIPGTDTVLKIGGYVRVQDDVTLEPDGQADPDRIQYYTPRFAGFQLDYPYEPQPQPTETSPAPSNETTGQQSSAGSGDIGWAVQGGYELDYFTNRWQLELSATYQTFESDAGTPRTSQAKAGPLTPSAERLGFEVFPTDRFFNSRASWSQDFDDQWALKRIGFDAVAIEDAADALWPVAGTPVIVAVLDTGIDRGHPDLAGAIALNRKEIFGNKADDDGNGFIDDALGWNFVAENFDTWDDNGHGTVVAGIIAARTDNGLGIAGVNPFARVLPVKVTDSNHKSGSKLIAKGIRYAVDQGARVINISIGGPKLTEEEAGAVTYALSKGALVVVASGNLGADTADFGPAGTGGVITVAATDQNDARAGYSNFGQAVDISAPGEGILSLRAINTDLITKADKDYKPGSAFVGGAQDYYVASGTSFAAPFVSGVASLILSKNPKLTGEQVKRMILNSARDIDIPGIDQNTGYGLLDARSALGADPAFFVEARINDLALASSGGGQAIRVIGTADADRFAGARVEIGAGERPSNWKVVKDRIAAPVTGGTLVDIPTASFAGSTTWTIRVVVRHANGRERENRFTLKLG